MNLNISMVSQIPIYEQIENQIREMILSGELSTGECLPSIRFMAKELRVGIVTVKRAYEDLCNEELLVSMPGKGVYVSKIDSKKVKNAHREIIKEQIKDIISYAKSVDISSEEIIQMIKEDE